MIVEKPNFLTHSYLPTERNAIKFVSQSSLYLPVITFKILLSAYQKKLF